MYNFKEEVQRQPSDKGHTTRKQHESNTIQHGDQSLLHLNLDTKVQMIAYADNLTIHGGPIGDDILYKPMTTAQKKCQGKYNVLYGD